MIKWTLFLLIICLNGTDGPRLVVEPAKKDAVSIVRCWAHEFFRVNRNVFTVDTLKILMVAAPLYTGARAADHEIHSCFYDAVNHKNLWQPPRSCHHLMYDIEVPAFASAGILASFSIFSKNERLRTVSRMYIWGAISISLAKVILKNIFMHTYPCGITERPFNEHFPKEKKHNGFPSGHSAFFTYTMTYWGLEYGWKAFLPLAALGASVMAIVVNCNNHYLSQVVGGMTLGVIYAAATHKVASAQLEERVHLLLHADPKGKICAGVEIKF